MVKLQFIRVGKEDAYYAAPYLKEFVEMSETNILYSTNKRLQELQTYEKRNRGFGGTFYLDTEMAKPVTFYKVFIRILETNVKSEREDNYTRRSPLITGAIAMGGYYTQELMHILDPLSFTITLGENE